MEEQIDFGDEHLHNHKIRCRRCDNDGYERHDAYGISTGYWCDNCYKNNYPYRRDRYYDYFNAGEYLDDDY